MTLVVIIQARMGSTRLPGEVLLPLAGAPLLERMVERLRAARTRFELVVATTESPDDEPIIAACRRMDVRGFRGHPTDLLDRHSRAARIFRARAIAKIPSDCPLIDPGVVDRVLTSFLAAAGQLDSVSNLHRGPAAAVELARFERYPVELWRQMLEANVTSVFLACQRLGTPTAERGAGSIVDVASTCGLVAPRRALYRRPAGTQSSGSPRHARGRARRLALPRGGGGGRGAFRDFADWILALSARPRSPAESPTETEGANA